MDVLAWWNLPYFLIFLVGVTLIGLMSLGTLHWEPHIHLDHDFHHDIDHDQDSEISHDASSLARFLSFFGLGKVPLTVVITTFCCSWGISGLFINRAFQEFTPLPPSLFVIPTFVVATIFASLVNKLTTNVVANIFPKTQSLGIKKIDLVGRVGTVRHSVGATFGVVTVADPSGGLHDVSCIVLNSSETLDKGQKALLLDFDPKTEIYRVTKYDPDLSQSFDNLAPKEN